MALKAKIWKSSFASSERKGQGAITFQMQKTMPVLKSMPLYVYNSFFCLFYNVWHIKAEKPSAPLKERLQYLVKKSSHLHIHSLINLQYLGYASVAHDPHFSLASLLRVTIQALQEQTDSLSGNISHPPLCNYQHDKVNLAAV